MPDTYTDDMFSDEQVAEALSSLTTWETWEDVATLINGDYKHGVVTAFSALAGQLGLSVTVSGSGLVIRRQRTDADKRAIALRGLRYRAGRGEIVPANLPATEEGTPE